MKKTIITAVLFLTTIFLTTSCNKRTDVKPEPNFKVSAFDDKKDVESAD